MARGFPGRRWLVPDGVSYLQIFLALFLGSVLGWTPSLVTLHTLLILLLLVFIRVPVLLLLLTAGVCWLLGAFAIDPWIDQLGRRILNYEGLQALWTQISQAPLVPWTRFANSMVMGAAALALICLPIWLLLSWKLGGVAKGSSQ